MSEWRATRFVGYEVSDDGRVRGPSGRILRGRLRGKGYPSITASHGVVVYVHELVRTAFHGPKPSPRHQVAHGNGVPTDNRVCNLRWATPAENTEDARRHGTYPLRPGGRGPANGHARLTWEQVESIRLKAANGITQAALAVEYGVGKSQIHNIVAGKQWVVREERRP